MEVFIEIYTKGGPNLNPRKLPNLTKTNPELKYYHLWLPDDNADNFVVLFDSIYRVIREMQDGKHRCEQNRFPNMMELYEY